MGLPIFSLPQLVLQEIVWNMLPGELVCLSLCSQKSHTIVRTFRNKKIKWEYLMVPGVSGRISLWFDNGKVKSTMIGALDISNAPENSQKIIIRGHSVPCSWHWFYNLVTYWDDENYGMKVVAEYCSQLLDNMDVHTLLPDTKSMLWAMKWVMSRQVAPLESIQLCGFTKKIGGEDFDELLRTCNATKDLIVCGYPPIGFSFSGRLPPCEHISFQSSLWLTIENLLTLDSVVAHFDQSRLLSSQINQFLMAWLDGQCAPRLKYCQIQLPGIAVVNEVLGG
ncbi:unnamed protein product, partial [Caenorhabditis brenneri]